MEILNYCHLLLASFFTVLAEQDSAAAQQYVRQGCPTALRADLWALILNISNQPEVRGKVRAKCEGLCANMFFSVLEKDNEIFY